MSADLLNYYRNMKSENNSKWLRDTRYKSAQLMHVQVQKMNFASKTYLVLAMDDSLITY